jgi:hypothetical protein
LTFWLESEGQQYYTRALIFGVDLSFSGGGQPDWDPARKKAIAKLNQNQPLAYFFTTENMRPYKLINGNFYGKDSPRT